MQIDAYCIHMAFLVLLNMMMLTVFYYVKRFLIYLTAIPFLSDCAMVSMRTVSKVNVGEIYEALND